MSRHRPLSVVGLGSHAPFACERGEQDCCSSLFLGGWLIWWCIGVIGDMNCLWEGLDEKSFCFGRCDRGVGAVG